MKSKNYFKLIIALGCILLLGNNAFSQETLQANELNRQWTHYTNIDGVNVLIKKEIVDVGSPKAFTYGMLRFENTTNRDITVEYFFELQYENGCVGCGNVEEYRKAVTIPAGTALEGDAAFDQADLTFLINNPYQTELGDFQSLKAGQLIIK